TDRRVRAEGTHRPRRGDRGGGRALPRGDRPAVAVPTRPRTGVRVGPQDGPPGRGTRGTRQPRHGRRGGRARHREMLLLARSPGHPGDRLRHAPPAPPPGRGVPARSGPGPRRRRPDIRVVSGVSRIKEFPLPDLGEGLTEGEILKWLVQVGDTVELNQPIVEVETAKAAVEIPAKWG